MTHTEKYELPLIEGTDVIDYAPFNEGMEKIEDAIEHNETLVQEAVDDVAEMGDTLNQKVEEINQALEQTEQDVNTSLEQTTQDLTEMVNDRLDSISTFYAARQYEMPEDTYYFGSQSGSLFFPLTSVVPTIQRGATFTNNRFTVPMGTQTGTPVSKVDIDLNVEPTGNDGVYNGNCNTTIEIIKYRSGQPSVTIDTLTINTSVKTPIHITTLCTASGGDTFGIYLSSGYTHKLVGSAKITIENIGKNN